MTPVHETNVQAPAVQDAEGVAVRVTTVPCGKLALHVPDMIPAVEVQLSPAGTLTAVPIPWSVPVTVTFKLGGVRVKDDATFAAAVMVILQGEVAQPAPLNPPKVLFPSAVAVRTTEAPEA